MDETLVSLRRDLHRRPEPAWREFYTTARIADAIDDLGVDALHVGPDAIATELRLAVPDDAELAAWYEQASRYDVDEELLARLEGGNTGAVAVLERGEGPTVGLRVDIDALPRPESDDTAHRPAAEGFRSEHEGAMHACGHDAHATIGVGVLREIAESDFAGTFKVFFQPAEEVAGGGKPMAHSGHLADVDALFAVHVGLDHPTGEVVTGVEGFLAVAHLEATFIGESAHAGGHPEQGRNATQALAAAVTNLHGIPRHADGATRINVGVVEGGSAPNVVAEEARLVAEVRGETTPLRDHVESHARRVLRSAAEMHDCDVAIETTAEAPSATSDADLSRIVADVAGEVDGVESVLERDDLGGSEDATVLMQRVQEDGGRACYVGIGTDHPGGHHTATFDVDEESIRHGVEVLAGAIERVADE